MSEDSRDDGGMAGRPSHGRRFYGVRPGHWLLAVAVLAGGVLFSLRERLVFADEGRSEKEVRASILIDAQPPRVLGRSDEVGALAPDFDRFRSLQIDLIKSRHILNSALLHPEIAKLEAIQARSDPAGWLEKELRIDSEASNSVLRISLPGVAAADAAALINAVADAYMNVVVEGERHRRANRLNSLTSLYEKYQAELQSKRKSLRDLADSVGMTQDEAQAIRRKMDLEEIADCRRDLHRIKLDKAADEVRLVRRKEAKGSSPDDLAAIAKLEEEIAVLAEQAKILTEDKERLEARISHAVRGGLDLQSERDEIDLAREVARKIGAEIGSLKVELTAPDRVQLLERAEAPGRGSRPAPRD